MYNERIIYNHYHQLQFNKNASCVFYELHSLPLLIVDVCDDISDTGVLSTSWDDVLTTKGDDTVVSEYEI